LAGKKIWVNVSVNTEITKIEDTTMARGWIFYDAACALCARGRQGAGRLFESRGFEWVPLQSPGAAARLGVPESAFDIRMHLLMADRRVLHNADALSVLCRSVWWLWPLGFVLHVRGFRQLGRLAYEWIGRNRYCLGGACRVDPKAQSRVGFPDYAVALFLPLIAGFASWHQPSWVLMWALAFGLGFGLEWLTWRDAIAYGACPSARRALAWFVLWPGLDGHTFFADAPVKRPQLHEWVWTAAVTCLGTFLIRVAVSPMLSGQATTAAWVGMTGIVLFTHFGVIRLISVLCRHFGMNAEPIMNAPFRATSLAEFWGARWNTAFSIPARRLVLLPLGRWMGLPEAGFLVFVMSGLIHEVVISLPARGGFGLPTLYFVLQGAGVAIERSRVGRSWGLGKGIKGRLLAILFTVGPLYWLFHPEFEHNVIVPFLNVLNNS
jgi:predicted DCC family thiol-disulfide oxidoreductase YuxK